MKDITLLRQYIKSISKFSRLTRHEEKDLAQRIKKGEQGALEKLINANLKLVIKIAAEYCFGKSSLMDIIQNGNIGLMKAAQKFNPLLGVKFSTYAAFWIRQSILRGFIKPSINVSISYRKDEVNKKIKKYIRDHFTRNEKLPHVTDMIRDLRVKRRDVIDMIMLYKGNGEFQYSSSRLDQDDGLEETIHDNRYNPETVFEKKKLIEDVMTAVDSFPDRERDIIKNRYGLKDDSRQTLDKLGNKYSISAEAARQIEKKVLKNIKMRFPYLVYYYYAS